MLHPIVLVGLILFNLLPPPLNARPATSSGSRLDIVIEELAQVRFLSRVDVDEYKRSFAESSHRLILLDNDPVEGFPTEDYANTCEVLLKLAEHPKNEVWIISGKTLANLQEKYGHITNLNLAGELGTDILPAKGKVAPSLPPISSNTESLLRELVKLAEDVGIPETSFKSFKHYVVFRHPKENTRLDDISQTETQVILNGMISLTRTKAFSDFELVTYPESSFSALVHKGCNKGDQYIDEPMHRSMRSRGFFSVIVTKHEDQNTYARNKLSDHKEVHDLLKSLSDD
ncbi:hypothetical protein PGTUg99_025028 [Puccinia graminis f. sp. tritici]|uniref:Uncharacterized protein n=1 Tax=Puccinia graminis f. sp. tritici TaxID=56615 RepID=A0A5B0SDZ6_PUCGR|nr:hypothetical protein PGTUg99_025028 [Puccinia graminis f. sp. tritici]